MRNLLIVLLCLTLPAFWPASARAHGPSVFEPAGTSKEHADHGAADAAHNGGAADEFDELHGQIDRLAEQLQAHDRRVRVTDVLGGIGYIVGITGAAYYYFGARRKRIPC